MAYIRQPDLAAASRPGLADHAKKWLAARRGEIEKTNPYPVILVTAAGGGIRAAYWTAGLLSAFQDENQAFAHHVYGISGVSGGSVGAGVFASFVKSKSQDCRKKAADILGADFLAPTLSTMLIRDVASSTFHLDGPDRAGALEQAFERSWKTIMKTSLFEESFEKLWEGPAESEVPALFLNITEASTATRVVLSNVSMVGVKDLDSSMQQDVERPGLRLSTALLLSARFPYISPEAKLVTEERVLRLVDGGFYDNSGAATVTSILPALERAAHELGIKERVRFVVIMIENDPESTSPVKEDLGGIGTPLAILDQIRAAQAERFKKELTALVLARKGTVVDDLRPESGAAEFPLGWSLSSITRTEMDRQIRNRLPTSAGALAEMMRLLPPQKR